MAVNCPAHANRRRERGFTLIEILVVMVIIAVLATLGVVTWQRTQRNSRAVACMNNLRQIGSGLAKYLAEHDGIFPTLEMARESRDEAKPAIDTWDPLESTCRHASLSIL